MAISVVQTVTANSLSITLPTAPTAGNALIVCVGSFSASSSAESSITGITLGGSSAGWTQATAGHGNDGAGDYNDAFIWYLADVPAGGPTSLVISGTNLLVASSDGGVVIYEVSGLSTTAPLDQVSNDGGNSLDWSSGATPATTSASEIWIGVGATYNTISGPGTPWTNSAFTYAVAGYQIVSATGTATYSGTQGSSGAWAAAVATFKAPSAAVTSTGAVTLAPLAVAGTASVPVTSSGAVTLAPLAVAGTGNVTLGSTGAVTLAPLAVAGTGNVTLGSTGAVTLSPLAVAGTGTALSPVTSTGAVTLSPLAVAGTGNVPVTSSGAVTLAPLAVAGTASIPVTSSGAVTLAPLAVAGTGNVPVPATTLAASVTPASGTDPYGNPYLAGLTAYNAADGIYAQLSTGYLITGKITTGSILGKVGDGPGVTFSTGQPATRFQTNGSGTLASEIDVIGPTSAGNGRIWVYAYDTSTLAAQSLVAGIYGKWIAMPGGVPETEHSLGPLGVTGLDITVSNYYMLPDGGVFISIKGVATGSVTAGSATFPNALQSGYIPATATLLPAMFGGNIAAGEPRPRLVISTNGNVSLHYPALSSGNDVSAGGRMDLQ